VDWYNFDKCPAKSGRDKRVRELPLPLGRVHRTRSVAPDKRRFQDPDAYEGFLWPSHRSGSLDGAFRQPSEVRSFICSVSKG